MRYLGVIPARMGSKRIPRKNVRPLGGIPLIGHTIRAAQQSKLLDDYVVSTESPDIERVCIDYGANIFHRPKSLATDETTTGAVLYHTLQAMEANGEAFDAVVCLHPTSPFRDAVHIDEAIELFEHKGVHIPLASVKELPLKAHPNVRHETMRSWYRGGLMLNGAIYIIPSDLIKKTRSHAHCDMHFYNMDNKSSIDIDEPLDWQIAEALCESTDEHSR